MSWLTSISVQTQGSAMHYLGGETCLVICLFYDTKWGNIISEGTGDFMILFSTYLHWGVGSYLKLGRQVVMWRAQSAPSD